MRISVRERGEKEVLHTLVQEDLFPTIVEALLRILVLVAFEDGCKRGNMLQTSQRQRAYQVEIRSNTHLGVAQEDLGLAVSLLDRAWPAQTQRLSHSHNKERGRALSLTVRGIGPAVELTYSMFISDIRVGYEWPVNLPLDTARHALVHHRDQFTTFASRQKCHHAPIWQLAPRIRSRLDVVVKFVNRATHVDNWELPRRVSDTPKAAELFMPTSPVTIV
jgi:hypothetical protein